MNAYDIFEAMQHNSFILKHDIDEMLLNGDDGDKIYATVYLLHKKTILYQEAYASIARWCGSYYTLLCWEYVLKYVDGENNIENVCLSLEEQSIDSLINFINLSPMFIIDRDVSYIVKLIEKVVKVYPDTDSDLNQVKDRLNRRIK